MSNDKLRSRRSVLRSAGSVAAGAISLGAVAAGTASASHEISIGDRVVVRCEECGTLRRPVWEYGFAYPPSDIIDWVYQNRNTGEVTALATSSKGYDYASIEWEQSGVEDGWVHVDSLVEL